MKILNLIFITLWLAAIVGALTVLSGCTSDHDFETGKRQLEAQGYTEVINTGYNAFCCAEEDNFSTGFSAKTNTGEYVEGCFCSNMYKGVTIRFE